MINFTSYILINLLNIYEIKVVAKLWDTIIFSNLQYYKCCSTMCKIIRNRLPSVFLLPLEEISNTS